jgi:hypothetical protein
MTTISLKIDFLKKSVINFSYPRFLSVPATFLSFAFKFDGEIIDYVILFE